MSSPQSSEIPLTPLEADSRGEVSRVELSADALEAIAVDTPLLPPREPLGARLASYFGRHLILLFLLSFGCFWAILSLPPLGRPELVAGQVAPRDYVAPQNAFLPDRVETEKRREAAAALVTPAYDPSPAAQGQALLKLREVVNKSRVAAAALRLQDAVPLKLPAVLPEKTFVLRSGWTPSISLLPTLRALQDQRWHVLERVAEDAVRAAYLKGRIRSDVADDLATLPPILRASIQKSSSAVDLSKQEREIAFDLAVQSARTPNVVVNQRATDEARKEAAAAVLPLYVRVEANTPLLREGERVTPEQLEQLGELGLATPHFRPLEALANGAICLLLVLGAAAYLARGHRDLIDRPSALWLVAAVPITFLAAFRMLLTVPHADFMMVPLAATVAMLLTVLIDTRVGLPAGFVVAAFCALMAHAEAGLFLAATLSAWIGALSVARLSSRFTLLRSVVLLTISNAVLAASLGLLREASLEELMSSVVWSVIAGVASVFAMAGLAIFLERPFGITSHLRLLELLAPDETVIRRMQLEAPGTYTHSMTVASLAEAAAKAIGADPLLCRVSGLYHDIGKLRRPHCFIENQSGDNIHDRLSPGLSALLIKAHVKDGLELGRAIRLPQPVVEVIVSHHGTSTIAYFLHRARQVAESEGGTVNEGTFRYPGPKPRSREAAIVMLADTVEASARSLPEITPEILETHVQSMLAARLREGELDDCDLSLKEMAVVRESFVTVLRGVLHGRIAYPDTAALSGELSAPSNDWVRVTLSDESVRTARGPAKAAETPQKRQNKEKGRGSGNEETPSSLKLGAIMPSGTEIERQSAKTEGQSTHRTRRRRFKPPFHAARNGSPQSDGQTSKSSGDSPPLPISDAVDIADASPQLEPRGPLDVQSNGLGTHAANGIDPPKNGHDGAIGQNGANGHRSDTASGSSPLSGAAGENADS